MLSRLLPPSARVAFAGAVTAPIGTLVLLVARGGGPRPGSGPYARPETLRLLALVTVLMASLPVVAGVLFGRGGHPAGRLTGPRLAALALAGIEGALVWWLWDRGGVVWAPAVVLLVVAAVVPQHRAPAVVTGVGPDPRHPTRPARMELVTAAVIAVVVGAVGRAATFSESSSVRSSALTVAASGLVVFGWAPMALALLVQRPGRRLCGLAGLVTALGAVGQPMGMQVGWFLPAGILLALAGVAPPRERRFVRF